MLGWASAEEVVDVLQHLRAAGVEIVTIGQYLQPKREKLDVVEYIHPTVSMNPRPRPVPRLPRRFPGPFVRSSYMADMVAHQAAVSD